MKHTLILLPLLSLALPSCTPSMPPVPPSNHAVVGPSGSTENVKSWSRTTKQEGNAVLGPLGNTERR